MRFVAVTAAICALLAFIPAASPSPSALSPSARAAKHDADVIRFFLHHPRLADTPAGRRAMWRILHRLSEQLRSLQSARAATPAHLALWRCIAGYPGARPGGGPGESWGNPRASNGSHFNVLQMTAPWGQGSYYVADPRSLSADEVIAAAERGYAANGYSRGWLQGQWGQTVGPCWQYAE